MCDDPVRAANLAKANEVRYARADLKRKLNDRPPSYGHELLLDPPPELERVKIAEFLTWLPGVNIKRGKAIMLGIVHTDTLTIGKASLVTREKLVERIKHYQPSRRMGASRMAVAA